MRGIASLGVAAAVLLGPVGAEAQRGVPGEGAGLSRSVSALAAAAQAFQFANTEHVAAGTGMRNSGSGTIRLRGIPAGSVVHRAFLYFAMICDGTCPDDVVGEFVGRTVTLSQIGTAPNPCWGTGSIAAYRGDVTGLMPSTSSRGDHHIANGDYQLTGFPSGDRTGGSPWPTPAVTPTRPLAEGATLLVVYRNGDASSGSRVYIHESVDSLITAGGTLDTTVALSPSAPTPITQAIFTRFGADGQTGAAPVASPGTSQDKTFVGGSVATLAQIAGDASTRDQDSDWNGADGGPLTQLWDTRTTDVTGLVPPGGSSYLVRYTAANDCFTPIGYVLQVRTGGD